MAQVVPELIYRSVLLEGLAWVKQNLTRVDSMMSAFSADDLSRFKELLQVQTVTVTQGWPRNSTPMPCISIVLMGETDEAFIGDYLGVSTETPQGIVEGAFWGSTHLLLIVTDNPDLTMFLYYLVKGLLQLSSEALKTYLHEVSYDSGDLQPNMNYLPDHLYARGVSIQARYLSGVQKNYGADISGISVRVREDSTVPFGQEELPPA